MTTETLYGISLTNRQRIALRKLLREKVEECNTLAVAALQRDDVPYAKDHAENAGNFAAVLELLRLASHGATE